MKKCTFVVDKFCFRFKTIDEVIRRANNSAYGLGAGVVTRSVDNAIKIANGLRTGTVYVNCYDVFDRLGEKKKKKKAFIIFCSFLNSFPSNVPFGGYKDSGIGRDLGEAGLKGYLENKTVIIRRPADSRQ